jgi:chaperonin GroEL
MINNPETGVCEFNDCLLLLTDSVINNFQDLIPLLEITVKVKKPLLIVAKELEGTAFPNLLVNIMQQTLRVCAIRAPDFGQDQLEILNDISVLTGAKVFSSDVNDDWTKANINDLGEATRIKVDRNKTVIVNENSDKSKIKERVKLLKSQMDNQENDWFKEKLHRRIGKLTGGVAVVSVGAPTESELLEKKERLDDAMNATKAAVQEGVVVGGGLALFNTTSALDDDADSMGKRILLTALQRPLKQLIDNSGQSMEYGIISETVGFNALTGSYEDLWESGILDPVKITKNAVITATSIAKLVLTTEVLVGEKQEEIYG